MRYLIRRLIFYLVALWASLTLNFAIPRLMPGNPVEVALATVPPAIRDNPVERRIIAASLGLSNEPMVVQYWHYLVNVAHLQFGTSFQYGTSVSAVIGTALPWTLYLVGLATLIAAVVGILAGILAAWRRGGIFDSVAPLLTMGFVSFPFFFLGLLLVYVVGFHLGWLPTGGAYTDDGVTRPPLVWTGDVLVHTILPATAIVVGTMGGYLLGMRNTMINTLAEDYVTMAEAKGLSAARVMLGYAARNALLPQVTGFALGLGYLVGGQVLVEDIFNYPGVGRLLAGALGSEDYPLIQALLFYFTVFVLGANLLADMLYGRLDPRVRAT